MGSKRISLLLFFCCLGLASAQQRSGNPLDTVPPHIQPLTHFGERAAWSPDGRRIAFVHKTLGDAFEVEVAGRAVRCLTCHFGHSGFYRVQYLPNGDYILIGPEMVRGLEEARWDESELWLLKSDLSSEPFRLGQRLSEGVAISRVVPRLAWVVSSRQYPDLIEENVTELWIGDVVYENGKPRIEGKKKIHQDRWPQCWLEAQDFRNRDRELIFSCYQPDNESEVVGVNLESGSVTNYTGSPDVYDEPEGIFPDGEYTLVESDLQNDRGDHFIDIWKLKLDGTGRDYTRLTFFSDFGGFKASNPVVSPDGRFMAFQMAKSKDEPGVGYGILLFDFAQFEDEARAEDDRTPAGQSVKKRGQTVE